MKASELYSRLDNGFIHDGIKDVDWAARMPGLDRHLCAGFKQNGGMGLMCDFADEVTAVYTTTFLSEAALDALLGGDAHDAMLFSHHPTGWDIKGRGGNYAADEKYITALRDRHISVYILHHPLDHFGAYSTCGTLAEKLSITVQRPAFLNYGAQCGIIGTTQCRTAGELRDHIARTMGHDASLYRYGKEDILGERVAICPGGGNTMPVINEMIENGVGTLISGVTVVNDRSRATHELAKANGINILGGTHYSTEKFAPMAMCGYFRALGLPSSFIADMPDLNDL